MIPIDVNEAINILKPAAFFVLGVVIYSIFIFKFYRFIAKRDIFKIDFNKYNKSKAPLLRKIVGFIFYVVEYVLLFPVFSFFWFAVLTVLISFLSKNTSVESILLTSMALVGAVRITSYYNEDLSKDLAKMLPFALLGVFLVDTSFFSLSASIELLWSIPSKYTLLLYYFIFILVLEFVARVFHGIVRLFVPARDKKQQVK